MFDREEYGVRKSDIDFIRENIKALKNEIHLKEYTLNLYMEDYLKSLKSRYSNRRCDFGTPDPVISRYLFVKKHNTWADGTPVDKRSREYRDMKSKYEMYRDALLKTVALKGKGVEIDEVIDFNFGEAKEYRFSYEGKNYELKIPKIKNVSRKSLENYGDQVFMLTLSIQEGNITWKNIISDLEEDSFIDRCEEYFRSL